MKQGRITLYNLQDEALGSHCYLNMKERQGFIDIWEEEAKKLGLVLGVDLYYQIAIRMEVIRPKFTEIKEKSADQIKGIYRAVVPDKSKPIQRHKPKYSNDDFVTKYL